MRIHQLKQILTIDRYGSINKAAQELLISQPALSAALTELENELGLSVFQRTRKGVVVTPEGQAILEEARSILESVDRITHITETAASLQQEMTIAYGAIFDFLIPDIAVAFQKRWPHIHLRFEAIDNLNTIIDALSKGHYRICLSCFTEAELEELQAIRRIKSTILFPRVEMHVYMYKDHPYAHKEVLTPAALQTEKLIMTDSALSSVYFQYHPYLKKACKIMTADIYSTLCMVERNIGVTLLNAPGAFSNPYRKNFADIISVPFKSGQADIDTFLAALVTVKSDMMTNAEAELVQIIQKEAADRSYHDQW